MSKRVKGFPREKTPDFDSSYPGVLIVPKNEEQKTLIKSIDENIITFVRGSAGTGKTFVSVYYGLQQYYKKKYDHLIFIRPAVEADGEKLGYLPGDISDKIDPYMVPIFDALVQQIGVIELNKLMKKNGRDSIIKIIPIAFMRGITFHRSFCVVDEAQNTTTKQMRLILTRLGNGSKIVITGDDKQSDINGLNGLTHAFKIFQGLQGISFVTMTQNAIVRHPLIAKIEEKYESNLET